MARHQSRPTDAGNSRMNNRGAFFTSGACHYFDLHGGRRKKRGEEKFGLNRALWASTKCKTARLGRARRGQSSSIRKHKTLRRLHGKKTTTSGSAPILSGFGGVLGAGACPRRTNPFARARFCYFDFRIHRTLVQSVWRTGERRISLDWQNVFSC